MTAPNAKTKRHRLYVPWLIALLGLAASAGAFRVLHNRENERIDFEFRRRAQGIANLMAGSMRNQQEALLTLRDLFQYSDAVTRTEFEHAANDLIAQHPGLQSLKWAPRVPSSQREKYEAAARAEVYPNFKIFAATPLAPAPSGQPQSPPDSFPIFYDAPFDSTARVLGLDLTTTPTWPEFQQAAREGTVHASGHVPYITSESIGDSYLIEFPVYLDTVPHSMQNHTGGPLRGFVLGVLKPSLVLEHLVSQLPHTGLDVLLVERRGGNEVYALYFLSSNLRADGTAVPGIDEIRTGQHDCIKLSFAGRNWEMWFRPAPEWLKTQDTPQEYVIGLFGLLITALLAIYLRVLFRQTTAVESVVAQRTIELTATQRELREDIQRRILTEQALKASEERYRTLVSQSSDAIWRLELSRPIPDSLPLDEQVERIMDTGLIAECNHLTAQMYGHKQAKEIIGQKLAFLSPPSCQRYESVLRAFVRSGYNLAEHESTDTAPGGETRTFLHNLIGVLENHQLVRIWVTERELTQQRLIQQEKLAFERRLAETQRLESLGVLAGGIAHDFNNLLTGILGHASLGRSELAAESPLHAHFEEIEIASQSAANLCQQMLAYAGKGRFVVKPYDLSQIVSQSAHLLNLAVSKQAELRLLLTDALPLVMADATQIQQIIMNLVINSSEAIGQRPGVISITTGLIQPDTTTFASCPYAPEKLAAAYVFLEVRDNGSGMGIDVLNRIFEPFFTTKFAGRGLGLAAALGIIRGHAGALRVESRLGEGTCFTLYLPAAEAPAKDEDTNNLTNSPWHAEGTLLIIDDEAPVRGIAERMARSLGFSALSAIDGRQGIELFRLYGKNVSAVLLDQSMPGLSGLETMELLRTLAPDVRVVMMSGYNQPDLPPSGKNKPHVFLSKPFSIAQFQSAVRQAIKHG